VNRPENVSTRQGESTQISCDPIHGTTYFLPIYEYTFDDSQMEDLNFALALASSSIPFDRDSVIFLHLFCPLKLIPFLKAKLPDTLLDKSLILGIIAAPVCAYNPIIRHFRCLSTT